MTDQLREAGVVERGWLGVSIQDLTPDLASSLGIVGETGAIVSSVIAGSPAAEAGFRQGDAVLAVGDDDVDSARDLTRRVANLSVGERVTFAVFRDGSRQELTATITRRDAAQVASINRQDAPEAVDADASSLGLGLAPLSPAMRRQFNLDESMDGVLISSVDPDSEAADKGLRPGNVIVSVGNNDVHAPSDVVQGIATAREADRENVLLLVADARGQRFVALSIEDNG